MTITQDLNDLADKLSRTAKRLDDPVFSEPLNNLERVANDFGKAWSGSWLGYHSHVYYAGFEVPPPGARFSREWGLQASWPIDDTRGDWQEFRASDVVDAIGAAAGNPDTNAQQEEALEATETFEETQSQILSALTHVLTDRPTDRFLADLHSQIEKLKVLNSRAIVYAMMPKGKVITRDTVAADKGYLTPPHISVLAKVGALRSPFIACRELAKITVRIASHIANQTRRASRDARIGTNVFLGHGRSTAWRDLKDFIQDRLGLPWDEFNRVPVAGVTNIARLSQMLDESAIAFLIMTAEDEQSDGKLRARMNVIHEAGLFQGRLGFERAIVLLEDGCEEFSNIQGLGQVRFPKDNIRAVFEDVRQILEREGLVN